MVTAIQNDQADFVKLFMTVENGIRFCDFLTPKRICDFYAKVCVAHNQDTNSK